MSLPAHNTKGMDGRPIKVTDRLEFSMSLAVFSAPFKTNHFIVNYGIKSLKLKSITDYLMTSEGSISESTHIQSAGNT